MNDNMTRHRILVTGGAGFIGGHLSTWLLNQGHHVTILDDFSGGFHSNVPQIRGRTWVEGSVTDERLVDTIFSEFKFDYVYHLAAYAAEGLSHFIRRFNYTNNLIGTTNIVNACVNYGVKHLTFTSSIAVYGDPDPYAVVDEEFPTRPVDPYGVAKLAAEHDIISAGLYFGLNYTIFRLHNVFGPQQNIGDPYRNVIGIFMNQVMQNKPMTVIGKGDQERAFTYVDDILPAMIEAPRTAPMWGEVFNLGSDDLYSINELAHLVAGVMGVKPDIQHVGRRIESTGFSIEHDKIHDVVVPHETPIEEGLHRMAEWAKRVGPRTGKPFSGIEIREELPEVWRGVVKEA